MIRTDRGLSATRESLMSLEEALLDLTRHRAEYHPRTFELLAAPIREEILARRAEIDQYIGMTTGPSSPSPSDARTPTDNSEPQSVGRRPILAVMAYQNKKLVLAGVSSHAPAAGVSFAPTTTLAG